MKIEKMKEFRDNVFYVIKVIFAIIFGIIFLIIGLFVWIPFFFISLIVWFFNDQSLKEIHVEYKDFIVYISTKLIGNL